MASEMACNVREMWSSNLLKGLNLEIAYHPMTMRRVVNLIIATERLKSRRSEAVLSTAFRDENLLNIMLESIVEVQTVFECDSAPPNHFSRMGQHQCSVTDSQKRSLILVHDSMELHAVMLQGGSDNRKIQLNMSTYVRPSPSTEARPVALGIKDTNLYLSCHKENDKPTLHLESVEDKDSLSRINSETDMVRFLFYQRDTGVNISTLMSARFPDWYISTAEQDNMPVAICQETAQRYKSFNIQRQN
uniref:Interleukin-1 n=1 Tax=Monopterus albus TaxID=43700 RepID=A0A2P1IUP9_MONAL|nr:interleukin-1 beta [Monopterus albus]